MNQFLFSISLSLQAFNNDGQEVVFTKDRQELEDREITGIFHTFCESRSWFLILDFQEKICVWRLCSGQLKYYTARTWEKSCKSSWRLRSEHFPQFQKGYLNNEASLSWLIVLHKLHRCWEWRLVWVPVVPEFNKSGIYCHFAIAYGHENTRLTEF